MTSARARTRFPLAPDSPCTLKQGNSDDSSRPPRHHRIPPQKRVEFILRVWLPLLATIAVFFARINGIVGKHEQAVGEVSQHKCADDVGKDLSGAAQTKSFRIRVLKSHDLPSSAKPRKAAALKDQPGSINAAPNTCCPPSPHHWRTETSPPRV